MSPSTSRCEPRRRRATACTIRLPRSSGCGHSISANMPRTSTNRVQRRRVVFTDPRGHAVGAGSLDVLRRPGAHDPRRRTVKVLAPVVVDPVVVGAQAGADHRTHGCRVVGEGLARQHRGELHHARSLLGRVVPSLAQLDGLMCYLCHGHLPIGRLLDRPPVWVSLTRRPRCRSQSPSPAAAPSRRRARVPPSGPRRPAPRRSQPRLPPPRLHDRLSPAASSSRPQGEQRTQLDEQVDLRKQRRGARPRIRSREPSRRTPRR